MHQVRLILVERADLLRKIRRIEIDVLRSGNVTGLEFFRRSNVEHDDVLPFLQSPLRLIGTDILHYSSRSFWLLRRKRSNDENGNEADGTNGFHNLTN